MTSEIPNQDRRCIALIGARGSGKSSVGPVLADLVGGGYVDTDETVERRAGKSVAEIFATEGEAGFRRHEREAVAEVVASPPAVLGLGGGAVLDERNVDAVRRVATVIWLTAPPDVLWQRISSDPFTTEARPPLTGFTGRGEVEHLLAQRAPLYERAADFSVDTVGATPPEVAEAIHTRIKERE
jgi:shikimate kinase